MQTYTDKLKELGIEALEESKDKVKAAIVESQLEIIRKAPQWAEKLVDMLPEVFAGDEPAA